MGAEQSKAPWEKHALKRQLDRILGCAMGVRIVPEGIWKPPSAMAMALAWLGAFLTLWVLALWLSPAPPENVAKLRILLFWGAFYYLTSICVAGRLTEEIFHTVNEDIRQRSSDEYANEVAKHLKKRLPSFVRIVVPLIVAFIGLLFALLMAAWDLNPAFAQRRFMDPSTYPAVLRWASSSGELILWSAAWFYFFLGSGMAGVGARFYSSFAEHLAMEEERIYILGATETPLVQGLARLSSQVLLWWAIVFLTLLSGLVLAFLPASDFRLWPSWFLFTIVPVLSFLALGLGTLTYLVTEFRIRATLQRFAANHAKELEQEANGLIRTSAAAAPNSREKVTQMAEWHDRIMTGARYGSRLGTATSILLPLLVPVAALVVNGYKALGPSETATSQFECGKDSLPGKPCPRDAAR